MIGSGVTYQVGIARVNDLRREAEGHRHAKVATAEPRREVSPERREAHERRGRALAMLRPGRPARA